MSEHKHFTTLDPATGIMYMFRVLRMSAENRPTFRYVMVVAEDPRIGSEIGGHKVIQLPRYCVDNCSDDDLRKMVYKKEPSLEWDVKSPYLYNAIAG